MYVLDCDHSRDGARASGVYTSSRGAEGAAPVSDSGSQVRHSHGQWKSGTVRTAFRYYP